MTKRGLETLGPRTAPLGVQAISAVVLWICDGIVLDSGCDSRICGGLFPCGIALVCRLFAFATTAMKRITMQQSSVARSFFEMLIPEFRRSRPRRLRLLNDSGHSLAAESLETRQLLTSDAVIDWNNVLLDAIRVDKVAPRVTVARTAKKAS